MRLDEVGETRNSLRPLIAKRLCLLGATLGAVAIAISGFGWITTDAEAQLPLVMPEDLDTAEGEGLYAINCASCHGESLEGQPDWRRPGSDGRLPAPPHDVTGHTWHHADELLFRYTKLGGRDSLAAEGVEFDSGMPGFGDRLSDTEIWTILAFIRSTWPEREQAAQAAATQSSLQNQGN